MFRRFSVNFALFSILLDYALIALTLFASTYLRAALSNLSFLKNLPQVHLPWLLYIVFPALWVGILLILSVYDGRKNIRVVDELGSVTLGSMIGMVSLAGLLYLSYRDVSRAMFLMFIFQGYVFMIAWRMVARLVFRWRGPMAMNYRRVVIAGAGENGRRLQAQIESQPFLGLKVIGFLDDDPHKRANQKDVLGTLDDAREMVAHKNVDDFVIALPRSAHKRLNGLVAILHDLPVKVWVIPDYFSLALHRASVEDFAGIPMLDLRAPALSEYQRMTKRAFDLAVALLLLIPSGIVMALVALMIRLDSPGPVVFRQKRVGENGRLFDMYKFRTMIDHADQLRHLVEVEDHQGKIKQNKCPQDPRVTRVGRFLRRTSLDELPQLINVLQGDMSLVGPRPELPYLVDKYELWQRKRFAVPQGMTGWWQINGRSDKPMHLHTQEDLYYVQHYSLWLDFQILAKTAWVVLHGKGAY